MWGRVAVVVLAASFCGCVPPASVHSKSSPLAAPKVVASPKGRFDSKHRPAPAQFVHKRVTPNAISSGGYFTRNIATPVPSASATVR
jgi:hypothetical protein